MEILHTKKYKIFIFHENIKQLKLDSVKRIKIIILQKNVLQAQIIVLLKKKKQLLLIMKNLIIYLILYPTKLLNTDTILIIND